MSIGIFRKKPVVIEAVQLRHDTFDDCYRFINGEKRGNFLETGNGIDPEDGAFKITTLEGVMKVSLGDWIIKEPFPTDDRKFYPCKPDIFEATYEGAVL